MGICDLSVLKEDETDQVIEEPDEIMHINRDSETKRYHQFDGKTVSFDWGMDCNSLAKLSPNIVSTISIAAGKISSSAIV
ncbi:hypothetical protein TNCV_298101 [Trichonephila clavipes]|nr:hypothetical protein TNCV_298101 [Trichonephila clavipes]